MISFFNNDVWQTNEEFQTQGCGLWPMLTRRQSVYNRGCPCPVRPRGQVSSSRGCGVLIHCIFGRCQENKPFVLECLFREDYGACLRIMTTAYGCIPRDSECLWRCFIQFFSCKANPIFCRVLAPCCLLCLAVALVSELEESNAGFQVQIRE